MLTIMVELAGQIDVPDHHVTEGRTVLSLTEKGVPVDHTLSRLIDIRHSETEPADAFVAVNYQNYWFWIDDRDFNSKRTFDI